MKTYKGTIRELLKREITVEARDPYEAYTIINEMYFDEKIVLDANDFEDYNITIKEI